jgi:hypothetical protein
VRASTTSIEDWMERQPSIGHSLPGCSWRIPTTLQLEYGWLLMQAVAVVQRAVRGQHPSQMMRAFGFGTLMLIAQFPVSMSGVPADAATLRCMQALGQ